MAGQPEIMIMTDYFNSKVKGSVMCDVKWMNPKNNTISFAHLQNKIWKIRAISRGKETKILFMNDEERHELLLHHFKAGCFIYVPSGKDIAITVNKFDENIEYERDHRFSFIMADGSTMLHMDRFHQSHWKWVDTGKWGPYRSPDILFDNNAFRKYLFKYRKHQYFKEPVYEVMMHQWFFNGFNNLIRCEVMARVSFSPFLPLIEILNDNENREEFFEACKYVMEQIYSLGGAQMGIWKNPFADSKKQFDSFTPTYSRTDYWLIDTKGKKFYVTAAHAHELSQYAVDKEIPWSKRHILSGF